MKSGQVYAVVDLETTEVQADGQRRLIQFSCVFLKNKRVINQFNTLLDPQAPVSREIQQLTGISLAQLNKAPLFEDLAATIYSLLQNTVFVAHNINFDYNFLNQELQRVGYPALELPGIDTVQLAQVLLPTLPSFKLSYLSKYLNLDHRHPHQADSDAAVTAQMLLFFQKRVDELPLETLAILKQFHSSFLRQTGDLFVEAYQKKLRQSQRLPSYLVKVKNLVIRRDSYQNSSRKTAIYPQSAAAKQKLFSGFLEWRQPQTEMMDQINQALSHKTTALLVEAPTGLGKTLGYLIPALYRVNVGEGCVVSTATTALQTQIVEQVLPLLSQILPFDFSTIILKGSGHYLDLAKFSAALKQLQSGQSRLLQLRILVWLLMTKTGDLDELHLTKYQDPLFDQIRHTGLESLNPADEFFEFDFLRRQRQHLNEADLLITNHAYLLQHAEQIGQQRILIVDEAHHLGPTALAASRQEIDLDQIKICSDTLLVMMQSQPSFSFKNLIAQNILVPALAQEMIRVVRVIDHQVPLIKQQLIERFVAVKPSAKIFEGLLPLKKIYGFIKENIGEFQAVATAADQLEELYFQFENLATSLQATKRLDKTAQNFLVDLLDWLKQLLKQLAAWKNFALEQIEQFGSAAFIWLKLPLTHENAHLHVIFGAFQMTGFLQAKVYRWFKQLIFVGASLALPPKKQDFICQQLDLPAKTPFIKLSGLFDYQQQALGLLVNDTPDISSQQPLYAAYISDLIAKILQTQPKQTMILFNSQNMLESVYHHLQQSSLTATRNILAQNITGSDEKIIKNFALGTKMVLLGTGTFWEGIDLPQTKLQELIIAQLPFSSPDTVVNQMRFQQLKQQKKSTFWELSLPEAMQRLQQGAGRLIRTPTDQGVIIVLDSRIVTRNYGRFLQAALPQKLPLKTLAANQLAVELEKFWQK
jgi:ATP-dependent DNA helicase DinG